GGVGIELWTMTEDILFDNIYVGHSVDDAKTLASETFDIKKTLEKAKKAAEVDDDDEEESFSEDPIGFIRSRILTFIDILKLDPLLAFKTHPILLQLQLSVGSRRSRRTLTRTTSSSSRTHIAQQCGSRLREKLGQRAEEEEDEQDAKGKGEEREARGYKTRRADRSCQLW
ncbi:hypothetical protein EV361DRAFT_874533, partial [Lentinula raphanica]